MNRLQRWLDWLFPIRVAALAKADELMARFGDQAYYAARKLQHEAMLHKDRSKERLYSRARVEIARRTGHVMGVDTATEYLYPSRTPKRAL